MPSRGLPSDVSTSVLSLRCAAPAQVRGCLIITRQLTDVPGGASLYSLTVLFDNSCTVSFQGMYDFAIVRLRFGEHFNEPEIP